MIVKFIIILALIIGYAVSIVRLTIEESFRFWKREYDSVKNKSDEFYIEFLCSKAKFIYDNSVSSAAKLIMASIFLLLLFFYEK